MQKFKKALIGLSTLLVLALIGIGGWLSTSLPSHPTSLMSPDLAGPVEIHRDAAAIPTIRAQTDDDAYFALGFVHAEDRFWQMELTRRFGAGRLSEILGEKTVAADKWMRTLGLYRLAEQQAQTLPKPVQNALAAYSKGVNHWLQNKTGLGAIEFAVFRYVPEPWRPADSLVWSKIMATRLSGNFHKEILRNRLAGRIGMDRMNAFWPDYPNQVTASAQSALAHLMARLENLSPWPVGLPEGASNQWIVGGERTQTGAPLLANDPHLGFAAPIMWYLAEIKTPTLRVSGATVPGMPFHILGHNGQLAWGITSTQADTEDLVVERLVEGQTDHYQRPVGIAPFTVREETIRIKDAAAQTFRVRSSGHGPVISDLRTDLTDVSGDASVISLNAMYLKPGDQTANALYLLNRATDWPGFRHALTYLRTPVLNVGFADTQGNIGMQVAGDIPVRASGDGSLPTQGQTGAGAWHGRVPFDQLPSVFNPSGDLILNANNPVGNIAQKPFISRDWAAPYRAQRIEQRLDDAAQLETDDMASIQLDTVSLMAREMVPALLALAKPQNDRESQALALLAGWDGDMDRGRPEPLIFSYWLRSLNETLYRDDLGRLADDLIALRPRFVLSVLRIDPVWCNNRETAPLETCASAVSESLGKTHTLLSEQYGTDMSAWRWGDAHQATFRHSIFKHIPLLNRLTDLALANSGSDYTVNRGASRVNNPKEPFAHIHGPGFRALYDLSDLSKSQFMIATGQSGNFLSPHYRDLLSDWRDGRYLQFQQ